MQTRTLAELAQELGGVVVGDGSIVIRGVAGIREAQPGDLTFLANARYEGYLGETRASAIICDRSPREAHLPLLQVDHPYLAFQKAVRLFRPDLYQPLPGVHPTAVVSPAATLGEGVSIGPHCVVEAGASIGARTVLIAGCYVGVQASIGEGGLLYPRVTVREECLIGARCILHAGAVIGADGFGFAFDAGRYHKVPQVGNVVLGDDVEVGANTTIDRATTDSTRIGDGCKIDNLVQIGHNVQMGRHCIVVAQVGISGSTILEDYVTIGGQAGVVGHLRLGKGVQIGAQSGVTKSIPAGAKMNGTPAEPLSLSLRLHAWLRRLPEVLPDLTGRTKELEARVDRLEANQKESVK